MKAAVLHQLGVAPVYGEFIEPVPQDNSQVLIQVKAAAIHNLDKLRAAGRHYANYSDFPTVVGFDGVGILEDGRNVYAQGLTGMMAEKAIATASNCVILPEGIDLALAAALPNAVLGSAMPLAYRAGLQAGETVLINGATGVTGAMAVQLAKLYGAANIIVTGRNADLLQKLAEFGATHFVSLQQEQEDAVKQIQEIHKAISIDIVIDYLWGQPLEIVLQGLKGSTGKPVRVVTAGEMAGSTITLPSGLLRSNTFQLSGSGIGSLSKSDMEDYTVKILPHIFGLASKGQIKMNIQKEELQDIETVWNKKAMPGAKAVIMI